MRLIEDAYQRAIESAKKLSDPYRRRLVLEEIAETMAKAGYGEHTLKVLEEATEHTDAIYKSAISATESKEVLQHLLEGLRRLETVKDKKELYLWIVHRLAYLSHFDLALDIINSLEDKKVASEGFVYVARALIKAGERKKACEVLELALKLAEEVEDVRSRSFLLRNIAWVLADLGQFDRSIDILGSIEFPYLRYDVLEHLGIIFANLGQWEKAKEFFKGALEISTEDLFDTLLNLGEALADKGKVELATEVYLFALQIVKRNQNKGFFSVKKLVEGFVKVGSLELAVQVVQEIEDVRTRYQKLKDIAKILAKTGQFQKAFGVLQAIKSPIERFKALAEISYLPKDFEKEIEVLYKEAVSLAQKMKDPRAKSWALADIGEALVKVGVFDLAFEVIKGIPLRWVYSLALKNIAKALAQVGQCELSLRAIQGIESQKLRARALKEVVKILRREKNFECALRLVQSMGDLSELHELIWDLIKTGQTKLAKQAIQFCFEEESKGKGDLSSVYARVCCMLADVGEFDSALNLAKDIQEPNALSWALEHIVGALLDAGYTEKALEIMQMALENIKRIKYPEDRSGALKRLAEILTDKGLPEVAYDLAISYGLSPLLFKDIAKALLENGKTDLAEKALKLAFGGAPTGIGAFYLEELFHLMLKGGYFELALGVALKIEKDYAISSALVEVVEALSRAGKKEEALLVAEAITDHVERLKVLVYL